MLHQLLLLLIGNFFAVAQPFTRRRRQASQTG